MSININFFAKFLLFIIIKVRKLGTVKRRSHKKKATRKGFLLDQTADYMHIEWRRVGYR